MPSVFTFFNGMTLTDSQSRAIEAILAFLADEKARVFILKGYAGTGKTTIVKGLTD
ncbi:MAG TPA: AAA family ATPase [Saprospiraceae bacterium]|nr:AAA family ATPase [Saprospiraceae bacterium]HNJ64034.1 AAA family ATPase [Saprospiraceae bacterium]